MQIPANVVRVDQLFAAGLLPTINNTSFFTLLNMKQKFFDRAGSACQKDFATYDSGNRPAVGFVFNSAGARKFAALTKNNTGSALAIMIDGVVMTAPVIREPIVGGRDEITGDFDIEGATDLAITCRTG